MRGHCREHVRRLGAGGLKQGLRKNPEVRLGRRLVVWNSNHHHVLIHFMRGILVEKRLRLCSPSLPSERGITPLATAARGNPPGLGSRGRRPVTAAAMPPRPRLTIQEHMYQDRHNEKLDWERAEGPDPRDPRFNGACGGKHTATETHSRIANQFMVKYSCSGCRLQLLYVPLHGYY